MGDGSGWLPWNLRNGVVMINSPGWGKGFKSHRKPPTKTAKLDFQWTKYLALNLILLWSPGSTVPKHVGVGQSLQGIFQPCSVKPKHGIPWSSSKWLVLMDDMDVQCPMHMRISQVLILRLLLIYKRCSYLILFVPSRNGEGLIDTYRCLQRLIIDIIWYWYWMIIIANYWYL